MRRQRQNIQERQLSLAFMAGERDEVPSPSQQGLELRTAASAPERPAREEGLMEGVCARAKLFSAWKRVRENQWSAGVDGRTIDETLAYLREHWPTLKSQLLAGTYRPQPVKRVEIPKPGGGVRKLGVPCVVDRLIQQALLQVLQKRWDPTFSEHSYGFRPGRSAHQAVAQAQRYVAGGYSLVVDLDRTDGARRGTGRRQARAQTHPGVSQRRGNGGRFGPSGERRHATGRPAFAPLKQPRARRSRQGT